MRLTVSAESVMRMLFERSIAWIWAPARTKPVMMPCASAMSMYFSSTIWETNWPRSGLTTGSPVSGSEKTVLTPCLRNSALGTTLRNFSSLTSSAMPLRLRTCSMAMRYCSSSRGDSAMERRVTFVSGEMPGAKIGVSPLRMA